LAKAQDGFGGEKGKMFGRLVRHDGLDLGPICVKCYKHAIDRERKVVSE